MPGLILCVQHVLVPLVWVTVYGYHIACAGLTLTLLGSAGWVLL